MVWLVAAQGMNMVSSKCSLRFFVSFFFLLLTGRGNNAKDEKLTNCKKLNQLIIHRNLGQSVGKTFFGLNNDAIKL